MSTQENQIADVLRSLDEKKHLRLGMDYAHDALWYGLPMGDKLAFLRTGNQLVTADQLPEGLRSGAGYLRDLPMSKGAIQRYLRAEVVEGDRLVRELADYFARHARYPHDELPVVLALWALAGFAHMAFPVFPYISITSAQRGSGKSRLLELISEVSFRAKPILVAPTAPVLFRTVDATAPVLLIDEFEDANEDGKQAMLAVLNSGFQRGAHVARCEGKDFVIRHFNTYGPKVFAGLNRIPETLQSRSIPILMFPKASGDVVESFSPITHAERTAAFRDNAAIWALSNAPALARAYEDRSKLGLPDDLEDRERDFMATLFATANVAKEGLDQLWTFCSRFAADRESRQGEGQATRAAKLLKAWLPQDQQLVRVSLKELADLFVKEGILSQPDSRAAGDLLRAMGVETKQLRAGTETFKGVELSRNVLDAIFKRFLRDARVIPMVSAA